MINAIAKKVRSQFGDHNLNFQSPRRLVFIVDKLNEFHYQARWGGLALRDAHSLLRIVLMQPLLTSILNCVRWTRPLLGELGSAQAANFAKIGQQPVGSLIVFFGLG